MSSSLETTCSIYLKRAAQHGNKWAGVWRWQASFLCIDTKTNFKWWSWQRTCSCLISLTILHCRQLVLLNDAGIILFTFKVNSKWNTVQAACVLSGVRNISVITDTSTGLKFGWKKNWTQRDYKIKDKEFSSFSIFSTKTQALILFTQDWNNKKQQHIKQMWLQEDFRLCGRYVLHTYE